MDARKFYDQRTTHRRSLEEGDGIRNTHNFIKAVLIGDHIPPGAHLLDLGCGQGGDLLKYKRAALRSYRGVDISHTAIEATAARISQINLKCRVRLECFDFTTHDWRDRTPNKIDAVSCQFAIQYAFVNRERARHVIECVESALRPGGVFVGTVPVHDAPSFEPVVVQLPDDDRSCVEYNAHKADLVDMCAEVGLRLKLWTSFDDYYAHSCAHKPELRKIMRAWSAPDPKNAVFVFQKKSLIDLVAAKPASSGRPSPDPST